MVVEELNTNNGSAKQHRDHDEIRNGMSAISLALAVMHVGKTTSEKIHICYSNWVST